MFSYDNQRLTSVFTEILPSNLPEHTFQWLTSPCQFNTTFVAIPRKTGKQHIKITSSQLNEIQNIRPGLHIESWTTDRLARIWLILQLDIADKQNYFTTIENLFLAAEVNELVALYSALPLLAYPEMWKARCAEGIRNNIGDVLTAIMCNNPYPSEQLNDAAWNQLVLKAFFTEKPINEIIGLDRRANEVLASTLSDYAHERWAAHRDVEPQLWRCIAPFISERFIPDINQLLASDKPVEKKAAALALYNSHSNEAKKLIPGELLRELQNGNLTWTSLSDKTNDYVLQQ